ncbi:MAG: Lrp/AsnC family transcriptional regulator [Pseudomonadota bacterium]
MLDHADRKILRLLQADARRTTAELAEAAGLSTSACHRRVKRLEADGLIAGYSAVLDRKAVGLNVLAYVFVRMEKHSEETLKRFIETVRRMDEIIACHAISGGGDYMLKLVVPDMDAFAEIALKSIARLPGVKEISSSFVLTTEKDERVWAIP